MAVRPYKLEISRVVSRIKHENSKYFPIALLLIRPSLLTPLPQFPDKILLI